MASECVAEIEEAVSLQTAAGHESVTETGVDGGGSCRHHGDRQRRRWRVAARAHPSSRAARPASPSPSQPARRVHGVAIEAELEAALRIAMPPMIQLTHHPSGPNTAPRQCGWCAREPARPVSETVTVTHDDGTTTEHTLTAHLSIPSKVVYKQVTLTIVHPERVEAEAVEREPVARSRSETLEMASSVGADAPFKTLTLPEPEPEPVPAEQTPLTDEETRGLFGLFGWRWPW